jgi:hypothetical protein
MFESTHLMQRLVSFYQADLLRDKLRETFGTDTTLEPQHLECLLLVVTQNIRVRFAYLGPRNHLAKF